MEGAVFIRWSRCPGPASGQRTCPHVPHLNNRKVIMMNYIKQINAFYNRTEQEPLTSSGVSLWDALMHINNKALWREAFTASGPVLRLKAGLTESSFKRARKELEEKGYITWKTRGRNLAPIYRITPLTFDS